MLPRALELAAESVLTNSDQANRQHVSDDIDIPTRLSKELRSVLYDP